MGLETLTVIAGEVNESIKFIIFPRLNSIDTSLIQQENYKVLLRLMLTTLKITKLPFLINNAPLPKIW